MEKLKWSFYFDVKQLNELKLLSNKTGVPQALFIREGLTYVLKKYRHITTMEPFDKDKTLYFLGGQRENITQFPYECNVGHKRRKT